MQHFTHEALPQRAVFGTGTPANKPGEVSRLGRSRNFVLTTRVQSKTLVPALLRHLHTFVRETEPSLDAWSFSVARASRNAHGAEIVDGIERERLPFEGRVISANCTPVPQAAMQPPWHSLQRTFGLKLLAGPAAA